MRIMGDNFSLAILLVAVERIACISRYAACKIRGKKNPLEIARQEPLIDKTNHAVRAQPRRNNWTISSSPPPWKFWRGFSVNFELRVDHECARVKPFWCKMELV